MQFHCSNQNLSFGITNDISTISNGVTDTGIALIDFRANEAFINKDISTFIVISTVDVNATDIPMTIISQYGALIDIFTEVTIIFKTTRTSIHKRANIIVVDGIVVTAMRTDDTHSSILSQM